MLELRGGLTPRFLDLGAGLAVVGGTALISTAAVRAPTSLILVIGLVAIAALFRMPVHWLPSIALCLYALAPVSAAEPRLLTRYLTPAVATLAVWHFRTALSGRLKDLSFSTSGMAALATLSLGSSLALTSTSQTSILWCLTILITVVLAPWSGRLADDLTWARLETTLVVLTSVVSMAVLIEYVTGWNPWLLVAGGAEDLGGQAASGRTSGPFLHPLNNATFLVFAIAWIILMRRRSFWRPFALISAVLALVTTVSRSSVIALGIALPLGFLVKLIRDRGVSRRRAVLVLGSAGAALIAVAQSPLLKARNESVAGIRSSEYRSLTYDMAIDLLARVWPLGAGAGTGNNSFVLFSAGRGLENSALQLMIGLGIFAVPLIALLAASLTRGARDSARLPAAAALIGVLIMMTGYNTLDVSPGRTVLLALAIAACWSSSAPGLAAADLPTQSAEVTNHPPERPHDGLEVQ